MTKVCTHQRDAALALEMPEQSLRRLQTNHLNLWQIHAVTYNKDPELFIRSGGEADAMVAAKKAGKVRHLGFTGHKDPEFHLKMLAMGFPFDAVQMPINWFDANFRSFENEVLPELSQKGMACLAMKPMGGHGEPVQKESSRPRSYCGIRCPLEGVTTIVGMEKPDYLEANLKVAQSFTPYRLTEMQALRGGRSRTRAMVASSRTRCPLSSTIPRRATPMASRRTCSRLSSGRWRGCRQQRQAILGSKRSQQSALAADGGFSG